MSGVFSYTCECNDTRCRRRIVLTQAQYRRLSAKGNVVHSDHIALDSDARSVAQVHETLSVDNRSEGAIASPIAVAASLEVGRCGVRAW